MNRWLVALVIFMGIILMGCVANGMSGEKPPNAFIKVADQTYETTRGSYCWDASRNSTMCVDTAGPVDLLQGENPVKVSPGEDVTFVMDYEPLPNEIHVTQMQENTETEVRVKNNQFQAPAEKGEYYYAYSVWWMDEKDEHLSNGDAFYAFVLEVE